MARCERTTFFEGVVWRTLFLVQVHPQCRSFPTTWKLSAGMAEHRSILRIFTACSTSMVGSSHRTLLLGKSFGVACLAGIGTAKIDMFCLVSGKQEPAKLQNNKQGSQFGSLNTPKHPHGSYTSPTRNTQGPSPNRNGSRGMAQHPTP